MVVDPTLQYGPMSRKSCCKEWGGKLVTEEVCLWMVAQNLDVTLRGSVLCLLKPTRMGAIWALDDHPM